MKRVKEKFGNEEKRRTKTNQVGSRERKKCRKETSLSIVKESWRKREKERRKKESTKGKIASNVGE